VISGSATNPKLTEQGFKNVFRTVGRDDQQVPRSRSTSNMKIKKVAIADDATAYGEGLANEVEKTLKAAGRASRGARERRPTRRPTSRRS
jgi:branched-chain amino acid transport system substrate-binding protein